MLVKEVYTYISEDDFKNVWLKELTFQDIVVEKKQFCSICHVREIIELFEGKGFICQCIFLPKKDGSDAELEINPLVFLSYW